jgi:hypothetical protein
MALLLNNKFTFGDEVYLKTDGDQAKRLVTTFKVYPTGVILYELSCGPNASWHYDFEMNLEPDMALKINN